MDFTRFLARLWENYVCPETLTTDGAANLTAKKVEEFVQAYGIHHRIISVANPHANCRAELAVRQVKRLLRDNIGQSGTLDTAKLSRALLTMRWQTAARFPSNATVEIDGGGMGEIGGPEGTCLSKESH